MENASIDFTKRLLEKRINYFSKDNFDFLSYFDRKSFVNSDVYKVLFEASMNAPRILGYIQQGKQLDQNTRALEQQEIALQLQINEMKESVKQQKELVEIQKQQYVDSSNSVAPYFGFNDLKIH